MRTKARGTKKVYMVVEHSVCDGPGATSVFFIECSKVSTAFRWAVNLCIDGKVPQTQNPNGYLTSDKPNGIPTVYMNFYHNEHKFTLDNDHWPDSETYNAAVLFDYEHAPFPGKIDLSCGFEIVAQIVTTVE